MKTVVRLMFIVCVAVLFASNVFAAWGTFYIQNHTRWPIDVSTGYGYCIHTVVPTQKTIMPYSPFMFEIKVNSDFFSKCGWYHSSQDFKITFTSANNQQYSITVTYYKEYGAHIAARLPTIPAYEHIKVTTYNGTLYSYSYPPGPIVTLSE